MPEKVRILLADDHALVRQGVRLILEAQPDLTVVAEAADGAEASIGSATPRWISRCWTSRCRG